MMSTSSTSFHDVSNLIFRFFLTYWLLQYLAADNFLLKSESFSPIQTNEDHLDEFFDNIHNRNPTVKRPMNAFLLWARGERKRLSSDGYGVSQTSLSKLLGETWR